MTTQTLSYTTTPPPPYAFLANPPQQKKRPTNQALPSPPLRRRSNTAQSTISAWAQHVQPGSPAPRSPRRRPSISGTRGRRPSITSIRVTSGSFLNITDTPRTATATATPSVKDFKADLTSVGYTSVFVHLPNTPFSATMPVMSNTTNAPVLASPVKKSTTNTRTLKHFRSLTILRSRSRPRSKSTGTLPSSPIKKSSSKATSNSKATKAATIAHQKKSKYAALLPPPLANDLALMQFADGGDMDANIQRLMLAQSKGAGGGVGDVHRDGKGGVWWDGDEELEYAHLLDGDGEMEWVEFDAEGEPKRESVSTLNSDLDPSRVVQPADDLPCIPPIPTTKTKTVLTIPARSSKELKKPLQASYLLDFEITFPPSPSFPPSPRSPAHTRFCASPTRARFHASPASRRRNMGSSRRRPAPLKLTPPSPGFKKPTNSPGQVRKDFIEASFAPSPLSPAAPPSPARLGSVGAEIVVARRGMAKKASMMNVKAFFRAGARKP